MKNYNLTIALFIEQFKNVLDRDYRIISDDKILELNITNDEKNEIEYMLKKYEDIIFNFDDYDITDNTTIFDLVKLWEDEK